MLMLGNSTGTRFWLVLIALVVGATILVGICWGIVQDSIERVHGRNWPTVSAVIDIVSVAFIKDNTSAPSANFVDFYYRATLTYTYNNPEQQIGDYSRDFADEDEANAWANSYKGETITVHVDPRDPARSVVRKEDL
jgi:hypothetical protein